MPDLITVLFVPAISYYDTLLADEAGGRVPGMYRGIDRHRQSVWARCRSTGGCKPQALLLMLNGEPVAMGCDRLVRVYGGQPKRSYTVDDVFAIAQEAERNGIGAIVSHAGKVTSAFSAE